ncbi:hypothetical protein [Pseudomonas sp. C2B4]|uniref:hypothetical protein n=1 Tax=Pseudomonas sp. C2B4 TaxID=2735270 RepID=UPI001586BEF6|nr:hypothetical protein [Pseudomonas sp. C2B4]NUU37364.1 hypothetical protein [Pseudomonas sp. C2B4]
MNAITLTENPASDYRAAMQQAAVAYLYRQNGQHLSGDHQLIENCTRYLAQVLEVPEHLVQRIAELAVTEFESMTTKRVARLGIYPASSAFRYMVWLLDTQTQKRYPVPARFLPARLLTSRNTSH